ncbi:MAG: hypothetical protein M5R40_29550 [Anaerolineae bacterium]|nr:hypothetical protein [Anaerolineae bacterium]
MTDGVLCFQEPGQTLEDALAEAVACYRRRFPGREPNAATLHRNTLAAAGLEPGAVVTVAGAALTLAVGASVLPRHLWVGREEA